MMVMKGDKTIVPILFLRWSGTLRYHRRRKGLSFFFFFPKRKEPTQNIEGRLVSGDIQKLIISSGFQKTEKKDGGVERLRLKEI